VNRISAPPLPGYEPGTLVDLYLEGIRASRPDAARTRSRDGTWTSHGSDELAVRVERVALGLRAAGLARGDRVALMSHTRLEWALADWAMAMSGVVSVPIYPVLPPDQVAYVLADAGATAIFVSDAEQLDKILEVRGGLPELRRVWTFESLDAPPRAASDGLEIASLDELAAGGEVARPDIGSTYESYARKTKPGDLATLIYTSGTTGPPKGVMLSHGNFHSNAAMATEMLPLGSDDVYLSLLPLAHVFERLVGHYANWRLGVTVAYAESPMTVARDLGETRPTLMAGVPRVFEKVLERAEAVAREGGPVKAGIFEWARRVGELAADRRLAGGRIGAVLALQLRIADRLVFSRLRARTGGRIRYFLSGGAPLPAAVGKFFFAAGLPIIEGYGLTETSPVLTFNPLDAPRPGTVGRPIPGTEIRIAEDGEILARGPQVMMGYYGQPETTAEALEGGWFHTGDIGEIDEDGYLRITDRKKDLIITAYGKNIAPQPIETLIKRDPLVGEAVLIGDGRKFPVVAVVPDYDAARGIVPGAAGRSDDDLFEDPAFRTAVDRAVESRSADLAHYERPRETVLLRGPFTVEGGELTPTLKVKRRVITTRYAEQIEAVYDRLEREHATGDDRAAETPGDVGG